MSSNQEDSSQLKAGHPPAVKVGNMRVTQRTRSISSSHDGDKDDVDVPVAVSFQPKTEVDPVEAASGVPESAQTANTAEAVKKFHEKPLPSHEYRNQGSNKPAFIQQPRK